MRYARLHCVGGQGSNRFYRSTRTLLVSGRGHTAVRQSDGRTARVAAAAAIISDTATRSASRDFNRVPSVAESVAVGSPAAYRVVFFFLPESHAVSSRRERVEGLTGTTAQEHRPTKSAVTVSRCSFRSTRQPPHGSTQNRHKARRRSTPAGVVYLCLPLHLCSQVRSMRQTIGNVRRLAYARKSLRRQMGSRCVRGCPERTDFPPPPRICQR